MRKNNLENGDVDEYEYDECKVHLSTLICNIFFSEQTLFVKNETGYKS